MREKQLERLSVVVASIAHLTYKEVRAVERAARVGGEELVAATDPFGVWVAANFSNTEVAARALPNVTAVLRWARNQEPPADWVRLDRDGPLIDGLPTFEW